MYNVLYICKMKDLVNPRKVLLSLAILLLHIINVQASNTIGSLLKELDKVIANDAVYIEQRESRINRLKLQLQQETAPDKKYEIADRIIVEYKSYKSDSALAYIKQNLELAKQLDNTILKIRADLQYAFVLTVSGLFVESEIILDNIPRRELSGELLIEYYKRKEVLNSNIDTYQEGKRLIKNYRKIANSYRDSIVLTLPVNSHDRLYYDYISAQSRGDFDRAIGYLETYVASLQPGTHDHARMSYSLSTVYRQMGNTELELKNLVLAVMSDVKDAIKENRALLDLAIFLYQHDDVERAFRYIQHALNDANYYNTRFRYYEISKVLPIITNAYQLQSNRQSKWLKIALAVISVLFLVFLSLLIYLNRQMRAIRLVRERMKASNESLETMNKKLNALNRELSEANLIKEEYIGHFLDLCSEYIGNLEDYKKTVNNKIVAKRFDELLRSTATNGKTDEAKDLYLNFDKAFLNIYPGFVTSMNELLKEEYRFEMKKGELLNTELRIFALIRLGITDSAKIASFLRCSVQTVYNYRSKIKRCCLIETDDIEQQIREIGKPDMQ